MFSKVAKTHKLYVTEGATIWEISKEGSGWTLEIPAGFQVDVSVPRLLEWFFSPHDNRHLFAATIHDRLLEEGHDAAFASSEFRRALRARGVSAQKAWAGFFGTLIATAFKGK